jgi:DNA-binding transcriptional regulator YbjK
MTDDSGRQAGADNERTKAVIMAAEEVIGKWDQEGGMSHRQLAERLFLIFSENEKSKVRA